MLKETLRLYLVTNRYQDPLETFLKKVEQACQSGVTMIQLRENSSRPISIMNLQKW